MVFTLEPIFATSMCDKDEAVCVVEYCTQSHPHALNVSHGSDGSDATYLLSGFYIFLILDKKMCEEYRFLTRAAVAWGAITR